MPWLARHALTEIRRCRLPCLRRDHVRKQETGCAHRRMILMLRFHGGGGNAGLLRNGLITSEASRRAIIQRVNSIDATINAVLQFLERARGGWCRSRGRRWRGNVYGLRRRSRSRRGRGSWSRCWGSRRLAIADFLLPAGRQVFLLPQTRRKLPLIRRVQSGRRKTTDEQNSTERISFHTHPLSAGDGLQ